MNRWGNIAFLIRRLEKLLIKMRRDQEAYDDKYIQSQQDMDLIYIDGLLLSSCARNELSQPKDSELLGCIRGEEQKYIFHQAAIKIQACVRAFLVSKVYKKTKKLIQYSNKIKNKWKLYKLYRLTMKRCEMIQNEKLTDWKVIQQEFKTNWSEISVNQRIEVHIPSLSYSDLSRNTMEK